MTKCHLKIKLLRLAVIDAQGTEELNRVPFGKVTQREQGITIWK